MIELYPLLLTRENPQRPVVAPKKVAKRHVCDDCRQPCHGGCEDYLSIRGEPRHGCADHHECARRKVAAHAPRPPA